MKKLLLLALVCASVEVCAQSGRGGVSSVLVFAGAPTGSCSSSQTAVNSTNGNYYSCNSGAWLLVGPGAAGSATWNSIIAPTGNQSVTMAAFTSTWTYNAATGAGVNLFTVTDTVNNTGTGVMVTFNTASGSALKPFQASSNGNGVQMSTAGVLAAIGTGVINATQLGGATFAAPGPIGGTTPSTGNFTSLSISGTALASTNLSDSANLVKTTASATFGANSYDFTGASATSPAKSGTTVGKPATCTVGNIYFATDAVAGQNFFYCTATNTWTQQLNSGGGFSNPMNTLGDIIYGGASGTASRLAGATTPNGVPQYYVSVPSAGAATAPQLQLAGVPVNAQTGTTYTVVASDRASYVTFSNASPIGVTLPQAGTAGFGSNFVFVACDLGAGAATIAPGGTSTISYTTGSAYTAGSAALSLATGQCAWIYSDNANYFAILRGAGGSGLSGMTAGQIPVAATPTTVTSSKALQGSDANVLTSGVVSGTGVSLCTDAGGGATTSGCPSGSGTPATQLGARTYTSVIASGTNPPSALGSPLVLTGSFASSGCSACATLTTFGETDTGVANNVAGFGESNPSVSPNKNPYFEAVSGTSSVTGVRWFVGLSQNTGVATQLASTSPSFAWVGFQFDTSVPDTHIMCVGSDGTTVSRVDSGVTPSAGGINTFEMIYSGGGTAVQFQINGTQVCGSSVTHFPTGTTQIGRVGGHSDLGAVALTSYNNIVYLSRLP